MTALVWWIIGIPGHGAFGGRSVIALAAILATLVMRNPKPAPAPAAAAAQPQLVA